MKNSKHTIVTDLAFVALLLLLFVSVMFIATLAGGAANMSTVAMLSVVFAVMIITYFTNITTGLIINTVLIFGYASWLLYRAVVVGEPVESGSYFWIIISPLLTACTAILFRASQGIEEENRQLKQQVADYVMVDPGSELKNKRAYATEMMVYRHLAKRYGKSLLLIVWEFRFESDMKRLVGSGKFDEVAIAISHAMESVFRKEDVLYLMGNAPYRWGTLMLTDPDNERMLMGRLREKIEGLDVRGILGRNAPKLEIRIGTCYDSDEYETPLQLLEKAVAQVQYDV